MQTLLSFTWWKTEVEHVAKAGKLVSDCQNHTERRKVESSTCTHKLKSCTWVRFLRWNHLKNSTIKWKEGRELRWNPRVISSRILVPILNKRHADQGETLQMCILECTAVVDRTFTLAIVKDPSLPYFLLDVGTSPLPPFSSSLLKTHHLPSLLLYQSEHVCFIL